MSFGPPRQKQHATQRLQEHAVFWPQTMLQQIPQGTKTHPHVHWPIRVLFRQQSNAKTNCPKVIPPGFAL